MMGAALSGVIFDDQERQNADRARATDDQLRPGAERPHVDADRYVRKVVAERPQCVHRRRHRKQWVDGDRQLGLDPASQAPGLIAEQGRLLGDPPCADEERPARLRKGGPIGCAVEHRRFGLRLQALDRVSHGSLGAVEGSCGFGEAASLHDHDEHPDLIQRESVHYPSTAIGTAARSRSRSDRATASAVRTRR